MTKNSESDSFPCPRCGRGRSDIEAGCTHCGWSPNPAPISFQPPQRVDIDPVVSQSARRRNYGIVAIVIGLAMVLGGIMASLVFGLVHDPSIPASFRVGGFLQIFVGLILALAGVLAIFDLHYWKWVCVAGIAAGAMNTVYVALDLFFLFRS